MFVRGVSALSKVQGGPGLSTGPLSVLLYNGVLYGVPRLFTLKNQKFIILKPTNSARTTTNSATKTHKFSQNHTS